MKPDADKAASRCAQLKLLKPLLLADYFMSTPRFYYAAKNSPKLAPGAVVTLPENAAIHACRVLRLQEKDSVILFQGDGNDYRCELISIRKNEVIAKVRAFHQVENESSINITLAQGISSGDRMDFTIQKAVEMGVTNIQPIASQRSVVKLNGERAEKRQTHWQNIVFSACEQCGRAVVPEVAAPLSLPEWLSRLKNNLRSETENCLPPLNLLLAPGAEQTLHEVPQPAGDITLLIGSEGGLTPEEISLATDCGFIAVRLGNRILRTETAALAAVAAMQTLWGDFSN